MVPYIKPDIRSHPDPTIIGGHVGVEYGLKDRKGGHIISGRTGFEALQYRPSTREYYTGGYDETRTFFNNKVKVRVGADKIGPIIDVNDRKLRY